MNGGIDVLALALNASLFVKIVMLILLLFSFLSWVIIFRKWSVLNRAVNGADAFEERFWSGADLAGLFREVTANGDQVNGIESIFEAGFREFARLRQRRQMDQRTILEGAQRGMRVALTRELDRLEHNLEFPSHVRSVSPHDGLPGAGAGNNAAVRALAKLQERTTVVLAPGISDALLPTPWAVTAAIPAVGASNRFSTKVE